MKMKKFLIVLMIIAFSTSVILMGTGCKQEEVSEEIVKEAEETSEEVEQEIEEEPEQSAITTEPIELSFWTLTGPFWFEFKEYYESINPNVTINITAQEFGFLWNMGPTAFASGKEDLDFSYYWGGLYVDELGKEGLLVDLAPYYEEYGWSDYMYDGTWEYKTPGSGMFVLNYAWVASPFMYYNTDIFEEVGVEPPETFEDIFDISEKIKAAGYETWALGASDAMAIGHLYMQLLARYADKDTYDKYCMWARLDPSEESADIFKIQESKDAFNMIIKLVEEGVLAKGVDVMDDGSARQVFTSGKAAMYSSGNWGTNNIRGENPELNFDSFPFPVISNDTQYINNTAISGAFCDCLVIPISTKENNPEKLAVIVDIMNTLITDPEVSKMISNIPNSKALPLEELEKLMDPITVQQIREVEAMGYVEAIDVWTGPLRTEPYRAVTQAVVGGKMTAEEAIEEMYRIALLDLEERVEQ